MHARKHTLHMHWNCKQKTKSKIESCAIIELFLNKINRARDQMRLLLLYGVRNTITINAINSYSSSGGGNSYSIWQRFNAPKSSAAYQFWNTKTYSHTLKKKSRKKPRVQIPSPLPSFTRSLAQSADAHSMPVNKKMAKRTKQCAAWKQAKNVYWAKSAAASTAKMDYKFIHVYVSTYIHVCWELFYWNRDDIRVCSLDGCMVHSNCNAFLDC